MSLFSLKMVQEKNLSCRSCSLRVENPVPGSGNQNAKLMLIGEYPSPDENLIGRPFEERSGLLFRKILGEAGINGDNIYMAYTVRCGACSSREVVDHVQDCKKWLWEEFKLLKPKIIITLGKMPTKLLLKPKSNFTLEKMAGTSYTRDFLPNCLIVPWYSPATILQRGNWFTKQCVDFFKIINEKINAK